MIRTTLAVVLLAGSTAWGQTLPAGKTADPAADLAKQAKLVAGAEPALVIVSYTLRFDKGEAPRGGSIPDHGADISDIVQDQRALEAPGYLVDATHVVTHDMQIHPRFIASISVRRYSDKGGGGAGVPANVSAYPQERDAVMLSLEKPLEGAKAATFSDKAGPASLIALSDEDSGRWHVTVDSLGGPLIFSQGKRLFSPGAGLAMGEDGDARGVTMGHRLPADGSWKGSPLSWPALSAEQMDAALTGARQAADHAVLRATLNFRSPKSSDPRQQYMSLRGDSGDDADNATVRQALAVAIDAHTVLVLASLKPTITARLERIHLESKPAVDATFKASLYDYGAFLATTDKALDGVPAVSTGDIRDLAGAPIPTATIELQGESRVATYEHRRVFNFHRGWRGNAYPDVAGEDKNLFLFTADGALAAVPLKRRERVTPADRYWTQDAVPTPLGPILAAMKDPKTAFDGANVPVSEAQENRLAWLGVELQPLTPELARINNVADQTADGQNGALVTFVYPDSPAAKAGVEQGWIILRVHTARQPYPIDVHLENDPYAGQAFPWDRLGEATEDVFDRIPSPWPPVENGLTRTITNLGFGSAYRVDFFHDGKVDSKPFTVAEGPPSYASAARYKFAPLGITVRNMTYEVRRYLQKKPDDPGVIISKIEQGSKASVAGLKPYELITHVNDQPVSDVKDFEKLTAGQSEIRLSVKRMTAGRIVKIELDAPAPTTQAH